MVTDLEDRKTFILEIAKALLDFGAPSHRIEADLAHAALTLGIVAQFMHSPSVVIATFGRIGSFTSEVHYVKVGGSGLNMGKVCSSIFSGRRISLLTSAATARKRQ